MVSFSSGVLTSLAVDDNIVCDIVQEQIEYNEKIKKSWVICGFPRTKVQALALQKMKVIPDKIVSMSCNSERCTDAISKHVKVQCPGISDEVIYLHSKRIMAEHEMQTSGVHDTFNHFVYHYDTCENKVE